MTFALVTLGCALAFVAYAYAGYPLIVLAWARLAPRPVKRADFTPEAVIVIVVRNGADLVEGKIASCLSQDYPAERLRVRLVSDGSSDDTVRRVEALGNARVCITARPERRGKAACLNEVIAACSEDFVVLTDARQRLDPQAVRRLLENFADPQVGAVSGELVFERDGITAFGEGMDAYWRYEKALRRAEARIHSCVGVTGALYGLRRDAFRPIPPDTILDDVLIPMQIAADGLRVVFDDRAIAYDRPSRDAREERARKVRTLAGNFQLIARHPWLLDMRKNPIALQLASHKLARLAVPLALAVALAANAALAIGAGAPFTLLLALHLAAYGLGVVGLAFPATRRIRMVGLAATFLALNAFVVLGWREYASNPRAHLWAGAAPTSGANRPGA